MDGDGVSPPWLSLGLPPHSHTHPTAGLILMLLQSKQCVYVHMYYFNSLRALYTRLQVVSIIYMWIYRQVVHYLHTKQFMTHQDTPTSLTISCLYRCSDKARNSTQRSEEQKYSSETQQYLLHLRLWPGCPSHWINRCIVILHVYIIIWIALNKYYIIMPFFIMNHYILRSCGHLQYQSQTRNEAIHGSRDSRWNY